MHFKYALISLPSIGPGFPRRSDTKISSSISFAEKKFLTSERMDNVGHWVKWMGELVWEEIVEQHEYELTTFMNTKKPEILDNENKILEKRVGNAFTAMKIAWPVAINDPKPYLVSGSAYQGGQNRMLKDIRSITKVDHSNIPWFRLDDEFSRIVHSHYIEVDVFATWETIFRCLVPNEANGELIPNAFQIQLAIMLFSRSLHAQWFDLSFPDFIRSAECLLALPKYTGSKDFAKRAIGFFPASLRQELEKYFGSLEDRLDKLYQIRNDCVHGRRFGEQTMQAWKTTSNDLETAEREAVGLAETVSRFILQGFILNVDLHKYTVDYSTLEAAWEDGSIGDALKV